MVNKRTSKAPYEVTAAGPHRELRGEKGERQCWDQVPGEHPRKWIWVGPSVGGRMEPGGAPGPVPRKMYRSYC